MSAFPKPPRGEFDAEGRHVHPYVRDSAPDASTSGYTTASGQRVTQEDRSRESRLAFHAVEVLLGHLTPLGMAYLMQALVHRLSLETLSDELEEFGKTRAELDPRGELLAFEELHECRLRAIAAAIEEILSVCPRCGRDHGEDCAGALQPGAYVNTSTGDAVSVRRVAERKVYAVAQVDATGREVARVYERDWFVEHFVPADEVEVLGSPIR